MGHHQLLGPQHHSLCARKKIPMDHVGKNLFSTKMLEFALKIGKLVKTFKSKQRWWLHGSKWLATIPNLHGPRHQTQLGSTIWLVNIAVRMPHGFNTVNTRAWDVCWAQVSMPSVFWKTSPKMQKCRNHTWQTSQNRQIFSNPAHKALKKIAWHKKCKGFVVKKRPTHPPKKSSCCRGDGFF